MLNIGWDLCGVSEISSGYILVRSVWRIRSFFKNNNAEDWINLNELIRHATAFGIYMISSIIRYTTHELWARYPDSGVALGTFLIGTLLWVIGSMIAQCFLCVIFWTLSGQIKKTREEHRESLRETEALIRQSTVSVQSLIR